MSIERKISKLEEKIIDCNDTLRDMPESEIIARRIIRAFKRSAVRKLSKAMLSL